jgi:hypothetical protein
MWELIRLGVSTPASFAAKKSQLNVQSYDRVSH